MWTERDRPVRLFFREARWSVEGEPVAITEIPNHQYHPLITHPTPAFMGWRCVMGSEDLTTKLVLAVRREGTLWRAEEVPGEQ
ncbi:hypothetical protein [Leucobacter luti]|uniref:hypothetical protein n=1 Tax=Leucobacter luti TaxID=340320 RepID=UPI001C68E13A|nr:hypothetical protein [Leucobacter luti]QYM76929.1 hypothetical protein K1X41_06005 [Leucobacter luti]